MSATEYKDAKKLRGELIETVDLLNQAIISNDKSFQELVTQILETACSVFGISESNKNRLLNSFDVRLKYNIIEHLLRQNEIFKYSHDLGFLNHLSRSRNTPFGLWLGLVQLSPLGMCTLPQNQIVLEKSAYVYFDKCPYLAWLTHTSQDSLFDETSSEQGWISKPALILAASTILSLDCGILSYYPITSLYMIPLRHYGLRIDKLNGNGLEQLIPLVEYYMQINEDLYGRNIQINSMNFSFRDDLDVNTIKKIADILQSQNDVLMRCVYYYTKACAYSSMPMFMEEATALYYFSLDGMVKLLMEKLKLTSVDAFATFLHDELDCPYSEYLEECYDERTIYVHPMNDFGEYWRPPWSADHCYETEDVVKDLINFYLFEKPLPTYGS